MGLTQSRSYRRSSGSLFCVGVACIVIATSLTLGACIDELPLQQTDTALAYVDGAILVDSTRQTLTLGRTNGIRVRGVPITSAEVEVANLSTDETYTYRHVGDGEYVADFTGRLGDVYQLRADIPGLGTFRSQPDSLGRGGYTLEADAALRVVRGADGRAVPTNFVTARVSIAPERGARLEGVLAVRQYTIWSYADLVCDVFDGSDVCYFIDRPATIPLESLDLAAISTAPGDTAVATFGAENLDFRFAQDGYLALEIRRYGPAATAYVTALSQALNPTGSPFDERPYPAAGNLRSENPDGEGLLGFFGVAEERPYYVRVLASEEVRGRIKPGPCATTRPVTQGLQLDCCFCDRSPGALAERPSYLP